MPFTQSAHSSVVFFYAKLLVKPRKSVCIRHVQNMQLLSGLISIAYALACRYYSTLNCYNF